MFCPNCGRNNPDYAAVCGGCGTVLRDDAPAQQNAYQPYQQPNNYQQQNAYQPYQQPNGYQQQNAYQPYQNQPYNQPYASPIAPAHPMKWYKFLIYFLLFFGAIMNVISAVIYMTGAHYIHPISLKNVADAVYNTWPGLETMDLLLGIASIGLAIFSVITRFRLSGYYKNAGNFVFLLYMIGAVVNLVYVTAVFSILGDDAAELVDLSNTFTGLAISIAIACCNKTYFNKRKDLFRN